MKEGSAQQLLRTAEWIVALVGALNCILMPVVFAQQSAWPFPGLYFLEIALMGVGVLVFVTMRTSLGARWSALPWVAAGVMLAFVVLGGFSIGPFLIPALFAFLLTGVLVDCQTGGSVTSHLAYLVLAFAVQAGAMGLLLQL